MSLAQFAYEKPERYPEELTEAHRGIAFEHLALEALKGTMGIEPKHPSSHFRIAEAISHVGFPESTEEWPSKVEEIRSYLSHPSQPRLEPDEILVDAIYLSDLPSELT